MAKIRGFPGRLLTFDEWMTKPNLFRISGAVIGADACAAANQQQINIHVFQCGDRLIDTLGDMAMKRALRAGFGEQTGYKRRVAVAYKAGARLGISWHQFASGDEMSGSCLG